MVKEGTRISVQAFMCNDLNLKGNMLLVYAIISGFTLYGREKEFYNSYDFICRWLSITRQAVASIVEQLVNMGLVKKPDKTNIRRVRLYTLEISDEYIHWEREIRFDSSTLLELREDSYVTIHSYMVNELKLKMNELILYAAIENLTVNGQKPRDDEIERIRPWLSVHDRTYKNTLKSLIKKGFISLEVDETTQYGVKYYKPIRTIDE